MPRSPDQDFKNLILDYPREALAFFAPSEAKALLLDNAVTITPVRQEQLKERLSTRFHALDVPLRVKWPDGRREALVFAVEEETVPGRFSPARLAVYCLQLAELLKTRRVVPVVIFLRGRPPGPDELTLGGDHGTYLRFHYLSCVLSDLDAANYVNSANIVARIVLPTMRWTTTDKLEILHAANAGVLSLEPDWDKQQKYLEFIDSYITLDEHEAHQYAQRYPQEETQMTGRFARARQEGRQEGHQTGLAEGMQHGIQIGEQQGELRKARQMLVLVLTKRFGEVDGMIRTQIEAADLTQLQVWFDRALEADNLQDVFRTH